MSRRVIPLTDVRQAAAGAQAGSTVATPASVASPLPERAPPPSGTPLADRRGRVLRDLRISVTDRCNFRCVYCMPRAVFDEHHPYLPHAALLSFEEITRLARLAVAAGVEKLRLTGGEPLLRKDLERLVAQLATLRTPAGRAPDLALTTNGVLLPRKAAALRAAGLSRVTVSLDALDDALFRRINDADTGVAEVLAGIEAARAAGFTGIKVNAVVQRGLNDDQILPLVRHFRGSGVTLRLIEFMDVGGSNGWRMDQVVSAAEMLERIGREFPLEAVPARTPGEVAQRWRHADGGGEIGVIASVTRAFCGGCNRLRLSTEGKLYTCLFASAGHDLRALLRGGADDTRIAAVLAGIWGTRDDRYSELRGLAGGTAPRVEMSYIGG